MKLIFSGRKFMAGRPSIRLVDPDNYKSGWYKPEAVYTMFKDLPEPGEFQKFLLSLLFLADKANRGMQKLFTQRLRKIYGFRVEFKD